MAGSDSTLPLPDLLAVFGDAYRSVKGRSRPISPSDHLLDDLDVDSLDSLELLESLEGRLGVNLIEIVADHLGTLETVDDFIVHVRTALSTAPDDNRP